jgi:hypothetical protein
MDGTLAHYTRWGNLLEFGEPVIVMVERVKQWLREGQEVRILTARMAPPFYPRHLTAYDVAQAVGDWTEQHVGQRLAATCSKDMGMIELWDDRCVQVEANTGEPVTYWVSRIK